MLANYRTLMGVGIVQKTNLPGVVAAAFVLAVMLVAAPIAYGQQAVRIAVGAPLTGPLARQGQEVANAVRLAAQEWNAKGGVLGSKIEVVEADDQGNPQVGVAAGEKVASDPSILGAVWGITSVTCIPVSEALDRVGMVMITPGCSNPKVTDRGLKTVERICARDDLQGPAGIAFAIRELHARKIAIFDDGTVGPRGAADEAEKTARAMGATPIRYVVRSGDKDFRAILETVPKDIDVVFSTLWAPDAALLAKQLPDVGLNVHIVGPDSEFEPVDYVQASAGAAEGNYVTFFAPDMTKVPAAVEFVKAYEAKYGQLSSYGPLAYEAANILLTAIRTTGTRDRAAIAETVRATRDYRGILGFPITFDAKGDIQGAQVYIYQVKGDGFVFLRGISVNG
jgi:branched-chain amino acid transport system substrate-binding protein